MAWESMCSMSLTSVVSPRSVLLTMRSAISCAESPLNCQIMLMTGILMSGKISTGVRRITNGVRIRTSSDATINVYGRLIAKRTIHIYIKVLGVAHFKPDCHRKKDFPPPQPAVSIDFLSEFLKLGKNV